MQDPLGRPSIPFRDRSINQHLEHHGAVAQGQITEFCPTRFAPDSDVRRYLPGFATVVFVDGVTRHKIKAIVPYSYEHLVRTGKIVEVTYCPHYPTKIFRIAWSQLS
jgi:hypothetical protein